MELAHETEVWFKERADGWARQELEMAKCHTGMKTTTIGGEEVKGSAGTPA